MISRFICTSVLLLFSVTLDGKFLDIPCKTPNNKDAFCISLYRCDILLKSLSTLNPQSLDFVRQSQCGILKDFLVCCGRDDNFVNDTSAISSVTAASVTTPTTHFEENLTLLPSKRLCGFQAKDNRFSADSRIAIDEFPWMVLVQTEMGGKFRTTCAGTIVSVRYILTAANCFANNRTMRLKFGLYDVDKDVYCNQDPTYPECTDPVVDREIEEVIIPPQHTEQAQYYDIALVRLKSPIKYSEYIRPICLALDEQNLPTNRTLLTSGWGYEPIKGVMSKVKKRVGHSRVSNEECGKRLPMKILDNVMCVANVGEGEKACNGDSGSPFMYVHKDQWYMEGLLSFGGVCETGAPIGGARISKFKTWILQNLRP